MSDKAGQVIQGITEITLSSDFDDDDHLKPERINTEYVQEQRFKGVRRRFKIFNDTQLYYSLKSFKHKDNKQHRINLSYVNAHPERDCVIAWKWLSTAIATIVWSMLLMYVGIFTQYKADFIVIVGVLLGTFSMLAIMVFYYQTQDKLIYKSFVADIPLFEVTNHKPGNKEFDTFMIALRKHIEQGQASMSMHRRLVGELKNLRRIRDEGTISNEQYESARTVIFKHEAYQAK
ncbi:MAG: hypothetical protein HKP12_12070 [Gammaproteobacteria bacterium]|nr:hypothetical protein [Gammaproteobacteria bacterium]NNJ97882.1 hypothetical protein [Gammaproteobacteria bacterium]